MSTLKPVFKQSGTSALYYLDTGDALSNEAFLPAFLSSSGSLKPSLEVEEAWNDDSGIYIFMTVAPPDVDAFILKVRELVQGQGYYNTKFLWVLDPSFTTSPWMGNKLLASKNADGTWSVLQTEAFWFADYNLSVGGACTIIGPTEENGYGFTFVPLAEYPNILFNTPLCSFPMSTPVMLLPLNCSTLGCFSLGFRLSNSGSEDSPSDFDLLQLYCAFFIPDPEQNPEGSVRTLKYPVLEQPKTAEVMLYGRFDPLNQLVGNRTSLSLIDPTGQNPAPSNMKSYYITTTGHHVYLTPLSGSSTEADARFVFAKRPLWSDPQASPSYYMSLEGSFSITVDTTSEETSSSSLIPSERIVCGISSVEYAGLMNNNGNTLHFIPGGNAYAPSFAKDSSNSENSLPLLTDLGTTSWVYITPSSEANRIYYYSQPEQSLMYDATNISLTDNGSAGHLNFIEIPAAVLPPASVPGGFPMVPFLGIDPDDVEYCRQLEYQTVSPARRKAIEDISSHMYNSDAVRGTTGNGITTGVTPQGLVVEMDDNLIDWKRLVLGNAAQPSSNINPISIDSSWLQLTDIRDSFRASLQSNQLFLVAADPTVFQSACSVRYCLTENSFSQLKQISPEKRGPDSILNTVKQKTEEAGYPIYDDKAAYQTQLTAWAPDITPYWESWETEGAYFELIISGWKFLLSPYHWFCDNRLSHQNTIMLMKFNNSALDELIKDTAAWPWPDVAKINGSLEKTQDELRSIFDSAKQSVAQAKENGTVSPYENFVNVITNPNWNGVLFLNCQVPLDQLPSQLQGIAVGIDTERFYAHHMGLNITPLSVENQTVQLGSTSSFGLIDYQDTDDLLLAQDIEFDFKVLVLTILFENSCIKAFSCRVELLICKLFGDLVLLENSEHGNNLILEGVCQTENGKDFYSFRQTGTNLYQSENSALETIEILSTRYITLVPENAQSNIAASRFTLGGNFYFTEIEGFDLFSFGLALNEESSGTIRDGYLRFSEFTIDMSFDTTDPNQRKNFLTRASEISFELSQSISRDNGLYLKFPLTLTGMVESPVTSVEDDQPKGVSPKELGFSSIGAPLQQGALTSPWYGLVMDLDLGTLGSLAGDLGLKISLLAAWCKTEPDNEPIVFVGMKFPGLSDLGVKLPIEGILSLGFRNIQFLSSETDKGRLYMLRLRQFGIRLLGLSFPPGNNDIYIFGNPDNQSNTKLGWYAAYSDGKDEDSSNSRKMLCGRRNRRGGKA
ncbi:MAG TPA: hypothetical protein VHT34_10680 [Clostridia bacterium]|nr:hypothetical protein [Clostridia bacterium]